MSEDTTPDGPKRRGPKRKADTIRFDEPIGASDELKAWLLKWPGQTVNERAQFVFRRAMVFWENGEEVKPPKRDMQASPNTPPAVSKYAKARGITPKRALVDLAKRGLELVQQEEAAEKARQAAWLAEIQGETVGMPDEPPLGEEFDIDAWNAANK